jgi:hypothetical protein
MATATVQTAISKHQIQPDQAPIVELRIEGQASVRYNSCGDINNSAEANWMKTSVRDAKIPHRGPVGTITG